MAVVYALRNTFTAADNTALTAYSPEYGPAWSAVAGTFKISSNTLIPNSNADGNSSTQDTGQADYVVWADLTPIHDGTDSNLSSPCIMFRYADTTHRCLVLLSSSAIKIFEDTGSGFTVRDSQSLTVTSGVSLHVLLAVAGNKLTTYVDGVQKNTFTGLVNTTATKVGVYLAKAGSPASVGSWDNFTAPSYTPGWDTLGPGQDFMILRPYGLADGTAAPMVIYHHGVGENALSLIGDTLKEDVIAGLGGVGYRVISSGANGDNWGNQASLDDYYTLYNAFAGAGVNTNALYFLSQSMGGCSGLLGLALDTRYSPLPTKWYGIYPVCSLANMFGGNAGTFAASIRAAFGIASDGSDYSTKTAGYDPLLVSAASFDNKYLRFIASPSDTVVSKSANSDAMSSHVSGHALANTVVTSSGDHGDPSNFRPQDVLDFYAGAGAFNAGWAAGATRGVVGSGVF